MESQSFEREFTQLAVRKLIIGGGLRPGIPGSPDRLRVWLRNRIRNIVTCHIVTSDIRISWYMYRTQISKLIAHHLKIAFIEGHIWFIRFDRNPSTLKNEVVHTLARNGCDMHADSKMAHVGKENWPIFILKHWNSLLTFESKVAFGVAIATF